MDGVTIYMVVVFSGVLALAGVILILGLRQKWEDEAAERHDIAAE